MFPCDTNPFRLTRTNANYSIFSGWKDRNAVTAGTADLTCRRRLCQRRRGNEDNQSGMIRISIGRPLFPAIRSPQITAGVRVTVRLSETLTASGPWITEPPPVLFQKLEQLRADELSQRRTGDAGDPMDPPRPLERMNPLRKRGRNRVGVRLPIDNEMNDLAQPL